MVSDSKSAGRRVNPIDIWKSGDLVIHMPGAFKCMVFKAIWGSLRVYLPATRKMAGRTEDVEVLTSMAEEKM